MWTDLCGGPTPPSACLSVHPPLRGHGASSHDSQQGADVVALDGIAAAGDDLVLGFPH